MTASDAPLRVALDVSAVPDRPVGAGQYILQLAGQLAGRPDIDLVLCARSADRVRWESTVPAGNLLATAPGPRPLRLAWEQLRLGPLLAASGAAVHHGPHYTMPRRPPVPSVVTVHDLSFFDAPEWHERSKVVLFRRAIRRAARDAAVVVCPSQVTADALGRWCTVAAEVVVAPHGVDTDRFRPEEPAPGADVERLASIDARLASGRPLLVVRGDPRAPKGRADPGPGVLGHRRPPPGVPPGPGRWAGMGSGRRRCRGHQVGTRAAGGADRIRGRRGHPGPAAHGGGRRLPVPLRGVRPSGPRGTGLRHHADHHGRHGHGGGGRSERPAGAAR